MGTTTIIDHPLAAQRLATLRDQHTTPTAFRHALHELSRILIYEACRGLPVEHFTVTTPLAPAPATRPAQPPILVPVLRAGLGMLDAGLELLPDAHVGFVGLKRDEATLKPDTYMTSVPEALDGRGAMVVDPMLATGGSLIETLRLLTDRGAGAITVVCVLAAPEGLAAVADAGFDVDTFTASVDDRLNDIGYILPGLGDAGDRQFGVA